jgi:membrane associated rhomboid family serine protease
VASNLFPCQRTAGERGQTENRIHHNPEAASTRTQHSPRSFPTMPPRLNIPPLTRILLIILVSQSTLSAAIRYRQWTEESDIVVPYLVLVPQLSLLYPWTFVLTALVENNVFTASIAGVTIFYGGRYLERAWTSKEFGKFLLIVTLIPNLLTFGTLVALFALTGDMSWT